MSNLIDAIYLGDNLRQFSNSETVTDEIEQRRFGPLGKINLLVGANNSGKSRLMRLLAATTQLHIVPRRNLLGGRSFDMVASEVRKFGEDVKEILERTRADVNALGQTANDCVDFRFLKEAETDSKKLLSIINNVAETSEPKSWTNRGEYRTAVIEARRAAKVLIEKWEGYGGVDVIFAPFQACDRLYIPTLRSLREIGSSDDLYEKQTREAYFKDTRNVRIFTGLHLYDQVTNKLLGDHDDREHIREFEKFIGDSFFEGKIVTLVPKPVKTGSPRELTIKIGSEREYPVRELGDGIQSILILTFPLFIQGDKPLFAFIEEPELFMHPWLQRVFLGVLSSRFSSHQYFLTTHSNHFLDLTLDVADVSVFTLEKHLLGDNVKQQQAQFKFTQVSGGHRRPLELLGVRNSSVFLSNCTIWVEGITDRRYVAHWLELYQQHLTDKEELASTRWLKEDLHYSFVEYSGANLVHWSLLDENGPDVERLCGRLFLIADSDGASETSAKGRNQVRLKEKLKEDFYLLPAKEIENLTAPEVLVEVLQSYGEEEANIKMPIHAAYLNKPLGKFIDEKMLNDPAKRMRRGSYASDNTISDKIGFCAKVIDATPNWNSLSREAQDLTIRVYDFIKRHH